eukprot:2256182-Rhodomonas_salina.1
MTKGPRYDHQRRNCLPETIDGINWTSTGSICTWHRGYGLTGGRLLSERSTSRPCSTTVCSLQAGTTASTPLRAISREKS